MARLSMCMFFVPLVLCGCDDSVPPTFTLDGEWAYSFFAVHPDTCQVPGLVQGCSGVGTVHLIQSKSILGGSYTERSGCQSCGIAWDFGGSDTLSSATLLEMTFMFTINNCRFTAEMPGEATDEITGEVECRISAELQALGTWSMTRSR